MNPSIHVENLRFRYDGAEVLHRTLRVHHCDRQHRRLAVRKSTNERQRLPGAPLILASLLAAGIIVVLQWLFILQDRFVTLGASIVLIGAAYVAARVSLRHLETNVLHNLHVVASGRSALFQEIE